MSRISFVLAALFCLVFSLPGAAAERPNIVLIYIDDLGYGDTSAYGATAVKTPHVDRLAAEGLRFTDGHCSSATCTPSRYALLTGEYAFRQKGTGVLPGDAKLIINPGRTTLPGVLKKAGYTTGVVGKWHLGLGNKGEETNWNGEVKPGPLEVGFDYCYIMPATGDRVPCVYLENHKIVGLNPAVDPLWVSFEKPFDDNEPTGKKNPELLKLHPSHGHDMSIINGISRIGYMHGGKSALWVDEDMADRLTGKALQFIEQHKDQPFFLYFATHDIHVPRVPHQRFVGSTDMGPRGDVITEMDWSTGQILDTLDRLNLSKNTIVIFSSDNGAVVDDGYKDQAVERLGKHKPSGPLRGGKYSAFEGGTRVPLIVRWPGRIKPGVTDALVCQVDFLASFAKLTGQSLSTSDAPDSLDVLPALLGDAKTGRTTLVEHAGVLGLREGNWKYTEPVAGRGPKGKGPMKINPNTHTEMGVDNVPQLYDLSVDLGEQHNIAAEHPDIVARMKTELARIRDAGRSRGE
jgi:arylsulfatase A-like enzyme